jgi:hypothetical protein
MPSVAQGQRWTTKKVVPDLATIKELTGRAGTGFLSPQKDSDMSYCSAIRKRIPFVKTEDALPTGIR